MITQIKKEIVQEWVDVIVSLRDRIVQVGGPDLVNHPGFQQFVAYTMPGTWGQIGSFPDRMSFYARAAAANILEPVELDRLFSWCAQTSPTRFLYVRGFELDTSPTDALARVRTVHALSICCVACNKNYGQWVESLNAEAIEIAAATIENMTCGHGRDSFVIFPKMHTLYTGPVRRPIPESCSRWFVQRCESFGTLALPPLVLPAKA